MEIEREKRIEHNMDRNIKFNKIVSNCLYYTEKRNSFLQKSRQRKKDLELLKI